MEQKMNPMNTDLDLVQNQRGKSFLAEVCLIFACLLRKCKCTLCLVFFCLSVYFLTNILYFDLSLAKSAEEGVLKCCI